MIRTSTPIRCAAGIASVLLLASACAIAQTQQVYRYLDTDGRVVYSDKPPPADARNAQAKRIGRNSIETSELSFATQQAQERFPVTLYTFSCGVVCDTAQGLLNKRGVPHTVVDVAQGDGADRLKKLTNGLEAPALQVGDQVATGFNEAKWQSMLSDAGYPKTPPPRTAAIGRPSTPAASDTGKTTTQVVTPDAAPKGSYPQ
ncbi:MAG: glutaredoxin family protein [Betaproteobacteria bacterium]